MWSDQAYYFSDSSFQLELNLQFVRRTLIQTLEDFEAADCTRCCCIKCRCAREPTPAAKTAPTPGQSLTGTTPVQSQSQKSQTEAIPPPSLTASGQDTDALKSPPATDLPRPDFNTSSETTDPPNKDVESWVRASTPNPDKTVSPGSKPYAYLSNFSCPPTPRTVWNDYKNKISRPEINTATVSQAANVQDFFKSFNVNMYCIGAKNAHTQNRAMMQKLKFMASKQAGPAYTYF